MEKFVDLGNGATAFIMGCKDDSGCEHQWDGDGLITFGNGETFSETEYHKILDTLDTEEKSKEWHKDKGSTMGECTCSKCGVPYTRVNNPYYL